MKWSVEEIRTFLDVMEAGTVSGAAARANLSKSVISKRISDLEAALGAALFRRHAGRITPTEGAEELALRLRPALAEMNDAVESAAWGMAGLRGTLAIAAPMSFGISHLSPVVADFARQHPELAVTLDYDDRAVDLVRGRFDLAVRIGQLRDSGLIARRLCEDPRVIVASPDYVTRRGMPESLAPAGTCQHWLSQRPCRQRLAVPGWRRNTDRDCDAEPRHGEQWRGHARHGHRRPRRRAAAAVCRA